MEDNFSFLLKATSTHLSLQKSKCLHFLFLFFSNIGLDGGFTRYVLALSGCKNGTQPQCCVKSLSQDKLFFGKCCNCFRYAGLRVTSTQHKTKWLQPWLKTTSQFSLGEAKRKRTFGKRRAWMLLLLTKAFLYFDEKDQILINFRL